MQMLLPAPNQWHTTAIIHGQSSERQHFQDMDLIPVLFRNGTNESSSAVIDV